MPCMGWDGHQWSSKLGDGLLPPRLSPAYVIVNSVYSINCMCWDGHGWLGMGPSSLVGADLCKPTHGEAHWGQQVGLHVTTFGLPMYFLLDLYFVSNLNIVILLHVQHAPILTARILIA